MGVMMKLRGLTELGQGRWEYRRRVPASAKAALGKSEWKRVIKARSDEDLLRQYARFSHLFAAEVGLPYRTYVLWRRLMVSVSRIAAGDTLTHAAH